MSRMTLQFLHIQYLACRYEQAKNAFHTQCPVETQTLTYLSQATKQFYERPTVTYTIGQVDEITFLQVSKEEFDTIRKTYALIKQIKQSLLSHPEYYNFLLEKLALKEVVVSCISLGHTVEELERELSSCYEPSLQKQTLVKVRKIGEGKVKPEVLVKHSYA